MTWTATAVNPAATARKRSARSAGTPVCAARAAASRVNHSAAASRSGTRTAARVAPSPTFTPTSSGPNAANPFSSVTSSPRNTVRVAPTCARCAVIHVPLVTVAAENSTMFFPPATVVPCA